MKLTRHNGRSGKNGAYNPKHNDRKFDLKKSDHIDEERAKRNVYWDCIQGFRTPMTPEQEQEIMHSFEDVEKAYYNEHYMDFCLAQHERNEKNGHPERNKWPDDLRTNKKTCPEESLIQIGTMEKHVEPEVLAEIAAKFFEVFEDRFGDHVHILDWSLHLDEATPHIHERHVFDCENRYGEIAPQQEKALEALDIPLPYPDKPPSKTNNRKVTFDAICRTILFDIAAEYDLHLDQEPTYGGRAYLEKQDYIRMKQKEEIAQQRKQLNALTIRIENKEEFIENTAEEAYQRAVTGVTKVVQEETEKADRQIVKDLKKSILSPGNKNTETVKQIAVQVLDRVLSKLQRFSKEITGKVTAVLQSPEKKKEIKEPIKESLRASLAANKIKSDEEYAVRKLERQLKPNRKSYEMSL